MKLCFFSLEETANTLVPFEHQAGTGQDARLDHKLPAAHAFSRAGWSRVCFSPRAKLEMKAVGIFSFFWSDEGQEARALGFSVRLTPVNQEAVTQVMGWV